MALRMLSACMHLRLYYLPVRLAGRARNGLRVPARSPCPSVRIHFPVYKATVQQLSLTRDKLPTRLLLCALRHCYDPQVFLDGVRRMELSASARHCMARVDAVVLHNLRVIERAFPRSLVI